jgi:F-type H+-transporting ATPase subunit delta
MAFESVARRYARALLQVALERGQEDDVLARLQGLQELWCAMPDLRHAIKDPQLPPERRITVLRQIAGEDSPEVLQEFLRVIVERRRVEVLRFGGTLLGEMLDEARGVRHATVTSAYPLSPDQEQRLREALRQVLGTEVILSTRLDPTIIGGVAARVGDLVLDGSLRQRLETIGRHLARQRELRSPAAS